MMRLSMDKRFRLGTTLNICLLAFFGLFTVYNVYKYDNMVKNALNSDIQTFASDEASINNCQLLIERLEAINAGEEQTQRSVIVKFRDDSQLFIKTISDSLGTQTTVSRDLLTQTEQFSKDTIDSQEFLKLQSAIRDNLKQLALQLSVIRKNKMKILNDKVDVLAQISKNIQSHITTALVLTVVIAFVGMFFLAHQIKLPIRKIIEIIRQVRDGNYSIAVRAHGGNEIDQIIAGLSNMAENLRVRDQLKIDKIQLEKKRFAALANFLNVPLLMVNREKKIAFANDDLMNLFKVAWDDLYEVDFAHAPLPISLREQLLPMIGEKTWVENEPCNVVAETCVYKLHVSLIPVKTAEHASDSVIITLAKVDHQKLELVSPIKV